MLAELTMSVSFSLFGLPLPLNLEAKNPHCVLEMTWP